jgi:predicted HTH domain antitoxin
MATEMIFTPDWRLDQLIKLSRSQPSIVDEVLRVGLDGNKAARWAVVVGAYLDEEISLGKAAELLGLSWIEVHDLFRQKRIPPKLGPDTVGEAQAEVEAARSYTNGN